MEDNDTDLVEEGLKSCEKCGEEMYKDCQGRYRCLNCDPPCPHCDDGSI